MLESLKQKWAEGKAVSNAWITIPHAWTTELVAMSAYDVLTIDAQHGLASDLACILPMLQAIEGSGAVPFVRLPYNDPAYIMRMLDAGVQGLICPMINTADDTKRFVEAAHYYPHGFRSFGPTRAAALYGGSAYFEKAKEHTFCMAMIETPGALKNIKEIVKTPELGGLYVGPWDLSISLGYKKHADFADPSFWAIMQEISEVAIAEGLQVGIHAGNPENAKKFIEIGYTFTTIFNDSTALKTMASNTLESFKGLSSSVPLKGY
jgi:4-hydroxy-2-oxoheptanedioate aldolase